MLGSLDLYADGGKGPHFLKGSPFKNLIFNIYVKLVQILLYDIDVHVFLILFAGQKLFESGIVQNLEGRIPHPKSCVPDIILLNEHPGFASSIILVIVN